MDPFDALRQVFRQEGEKVILRRGDVLIAAGATENHVYLIDKGAVRVVYRSEGHEYNIRFGYRGSVLTSLPSFFDGSASQFSIEALRRCSVFRLKREEFNALFANEKLQNRAYVQMLEGLINQQMEREIDLLTPSPAGRYQRVLDRSPQLFQEVPAYHIANYLRMTPETLSRLRKS